MFINLAEYKKSLRHIEVEEFMDLYLFRFLGYGVVKLIAWTNITPNQVTYIGMVFGVLSAYFLAMGTQSALFAAAIMLLIANVMDCADGQLARLKKNGTRMGSIIDGFFDYIVGASNVIGIGFYLSHYYSLAIILPLTIAAGLSRMIQNLLLDQRRRFCTNENDFSAASILDDYDKSLQELKFMAGTKGHFLDKIILRASLVYFAIQRRATRVTKVTLTDFRLILATPDDKAFIMQLWTFLGSSTHISFVIVTAFFNHLEIYFWTTITIGNFIMIVLLVTEIFFVHRLENTTVETE